MNFWQKRSKHRSLIPYWAIGLGIGMLFLGIGIWGEQITDIYRKAVMICLECIGIG